MKKIYILLIVVFLSFVIFSPSLASLNKVGQTGLQFLKVDVGARAAGMGGAYLMIGQDATAMFFNPAGIAMVSQFDAFVTQTKWIADISYNAAGAVYTWENVGSFGINLVYADYGEVIGTRVATNEKGFEETGNLKSSAYAVGLTYARRLTEKFTIGGSIKSAQQHLGSNSYEDGVSQENKVSGLSFDFGTVFYPGFYPSFRLGMAVRNFSAQFKYEEESFQLPLQFIIGFAFDVLDLAGDHNNSLLFSFDYSHPRDYTPRVHFGAEYLFMGMFALRAGYKLNYDVEGASGGLGFVKDFDGFGVRLGWSYSNVEVFDAVNRFEVGFSF